MNNLTEGEEYYLPHFAESVRALTLWCKHEIKVTWRYFVLLSNSDKLIPLSLVLATETEF